MPQSALRQTVRERLAAGWLFPAPHKVWAGKGTGHVCIVCGTTIGTSEVENEVVGPTTVWAHLPCYSIWREESEANNGSTGTDGAEYLANFRQIVRERFAKGTLFALPHDKSWTGRASPSNSVEWLLAQTFSTTIYVPQLFSETVADRALSALHDRAWSAVLGVASNKTPLAISTFNERAVLHYRQYEDAMTVFLVQRNEMPMMNALLENVSRGGSLDQRLDLWMSFNASMRAHKEVLTEIQSQFELVS